MKVIFCLMYFSAHLDQSCSPLVQFSCGQYLEAYFHITQLSAALLEYPQELSLFKWDRTTSNL